MSQIPPLPFQVRCLNNKTAIRLYYNSRHHFKAGSQKIFHLWVCSCCKVDTTSLNMTSLHCRIKAVVRDYNRIKSSKSQLRISAFEQQFFLFPNTSEKSRVNLTREESRTKALLAQLSIVKSKLKEARIISYRQKQNTKRKNNKVLELKDKIKVQKEQQPMEANVTSSITQTEPENVKLTAEKGCQCNTINNMMNEEICFWQKSMFRKRRR